MTGTIDIYKPDGSALATVTFDTDSYRREQVMGEHAVTLNFSLPQPDNGISQSFIDIPVGSYITFKGQRYTLYNPSNFTKNGNRNYAYTLKLEAYQATMADSIFINIPDGRTSFTRTARPHEFLESLVDNLNREDSDWTVGAYIEAVPTTIAFNETPCSEALRLVAEAFKTEWEVNGKEISLRKVEYFKNAPLALQYGQGNGFTQGLGRGNFDNSRPINRLFVRGGDRNIDYSTYGSQTLLLPSGQTMAYDGTYFQDEAGFNSAIARTYTVSGDGRSFIRTDVPAKSKREGSVELTDIYPMREGTVTQVLWYYKDVEYATYSTALAAAIADGADGGSVFCDIFDNTIPAALDYSGTRLNGEQMIVVFQTGMLSGREIGVQQDTESVTGYVHVDPSDPTKNRRFKLITEFTDGFPMPGGNFSPVVGDKYAVFGMKMPDSYVRDDATKSGASWDLFREAIRYKYENEDYRFTFKGELNGIWAQENWDTIEDKIVAGGYVQFSDPQFQPEGVLIRISAIKEYLHQPYKPTLELTNVVIGGGVRGELEKIDQQEVVIDERIKDIATLSNRQWRDAQELRRRLNDLHLGFTEAITPISVQTMQLIAGSEQLQFRFVNNRTAPVEVRPTVVYDPTQNTLQVQGGVIQHMTLGIDEITGAHALSEYKFWNVDALTTGPLEEDKLYWLYARVPKTGNANGTFVVTTDEMPFDTDPNYYNLLVGALNSEYGGNRSYSSLYGFTELLPGQITVNLIRSNDGRTYFDLAAGEIGGNITFLGNDNQNHSLANYLDDVENQIDGKIETWYQSGNPASSWTTAERANHTGDLWYNTLDNKTYRYTGSGTAIGTAWVSTDQLVDSKRRVFTTTPFPPYDMGDLWVDGTDLRYCDTSRQTGNHVASDWSLATIYDNTQTRIDGGLVTSGTIQVVGGTREPENIVSNSLAGVTGVGTTPDSVRIWAGNSYANRNTAPFRVLQNGKLFASNAEISGKITAEDGTIGGFIIADNHIGGDGTQLSSGMSLWPDRITFSQGGRYAFIGCNSTYATGQFKHSDSGGIALQLTASGSGGLAMDIVSGVIQGLRIKTDRISSSSTVDRSNTYVSCTNASSTSMYLPHPTGTATQAGDIKIFRPRTASITVRVSGGEARIHDGHGLVSSVVVNVGCLGLFVNDGEYWNFNWMDRS